MFRKATDEEMNIDTTGRKGRRVSGAYLGNLKWPFAKMEVGDAIEITIGEYGPQNPQAYVSTYGYKVGKKFRSRKITPDTYSIWRIA